ncbi:hypothetical protein N2152v2_005313 [Parachlorella kessleri]
MRPRAVAIALLAGLIGLGWARVQHFNIETNTISVKEPADAAGEYQAAIGDFGVPLYGGTLMGRVEVHRDNTDGCKNFTAVPPPSGDLPRIFLVDRGGRTPTGRTCYFVLKAWHAQLAGAKALIVADHTQEELVTMSVPFEHPEVADLIEKINIPVVLVTKDTGSKFKRAVGDDGKGNLVLELNWKESMTHPDDSGRRRWQQQQQKPRGRRRQAVLPDVYYNWWPCRVEWEMFFSTNNGCGELCASQTTFLLNFRGTAVSLERENHTQFTPHILTRPCYSWEPASSDRCQRDCIHGGRYCAWESVASQFQDKYHGAQVVEENKRHICVFQHVSKAGRPWAWWDFAARFASQCTMAAGRYDKACAEEMMRASNIDPVPVADCMGDIHENSFSPILEAEFRAQHDSTGVGYGDVIMLPTIIINSDQYRGRLDAPSVLRALCAGYKEGTEPPVCLTGGLNVDECSTGKHDCWQGPAGESACMDTFRGYICHCPPGWEGDGHVCQDIDECAMHIDGCDHECVNTPGSYYCKCNRGYKLVSVLGVVPGQGYIMQA